MNSQLFTDDFNRANSNTIGTGWNQTVATAGSLQILSNAFFMQGGTSAPRDGFVLRTETFNNNQYMKAKFLTYSDNDGSNLSTNGLVVRGSGTLTSFTGYGIFPANSGGSGARLVKMVNTNLNASPPTNVTNLQTGLTVTANDILELRANGTSITCLKNGAAFASATDAAIASGSVGFVDPFATNFTISQQHTTTWDDASGGDILPDVVDVVVNVSGVAATAGQGSVTITATAVVIPTGVAATCSPGAIVGGVANVTLAGVGATAAPGALTVTGSGQVALVGQEATVSPGAVVASISINVSVDGHQLTAEAGEPLAGPKYTGPFRTTGSRVIRNFLGAGSVK